MSLPAREWEIAQPKLLTPQHGGCGLGTALHQPHASPVPDPGIKDSPGVAVCHNNPWMQ